MKDRKVRPHLSSMMSLQDETMMHPTDEAMMAWRDETRLTGQKQSIDQSKSVRDQSADDVIKVYLQKQNLWF